jgi:pimeloyl-ACP methyl ester carboxylesterase
MAFQIVSAHQRRGVRIIALLAALCCTAAATPAQGERRLGRLAFTPCTLVAPGMPINVAAQCVRMQVPENHAQSGGRSISLAIAWIPAEAKAPAPDPVFMLAGGPGQSALESFPTIAPAFREIQRRHHVILVDQRGTGGSNPLVCRDAKGAKAVTDGSETDVEAAQRFAAACLRSLDADPRHYTTADAIADLEAVRGALGATQVNLVGISYGTRVAQEYLRRHPDRIRSVVLDGVVPPQLILGAEHARNLENAVNAQFARCTADRACTARYGSPRRNLDQLLQDLRKSPRSVAFRDPVSNQVRTDTLTAETVAGVVRLYAYAPNLFAMLPNTLAEASDGHPEMLLAQATMMESLLNEQINHGLQLSVICAEDEPFLKSDPSDATTLMGTAFVDFIKAQCAVWPRGDLPADFHQPVRSNKPVLLLSGEFDPVTPPRYGEQVASTLPNARHLTLRGQGHNVMAAGCAPRLMTQFIDRASVAGLDAKCLDQLIAPPLFTGAYGWEP